MRYGWGIVEARGDKEVTSVVVAPYDRQWRPIRERAEELEADCVAVGYGYVPRLQLLQMLGCEDEYRSFDGGSCPVTDPWQRTSRSQVYAAGDVAGVYGAETAVLQGRLAALGCLIDMGSTTADALAGEVRPLRAALARLSRFHDAFENFSRQRPGLLELPDPSTIICRCESVTREKLDDAIASGVRDMTSLKMAARIGMGDCQGKMCGSFCREYLMHRQQLEAEEVGRLRPRFPLVPVPFAALITEDPHE
jgi:hydrogen cyanide synthase HcnB